MITLREEKGTQLTHQEMDENFKSVMGGHNFLHIQDQKTQGTAGGTFTSGDWRTRDLNTVLMNTITGASLATNQITLPAGKYYIEASAPAFYVNGHQAKLRRITETASDILVGTAEFCLVGTISGACTTKSRISGIFQISNEVVFELQHRCEMTKTDNGLSSAAKITTEVYSDIRIWRIGEYVAP